MTKKELVEELEKMPDDWKVRIHHQSYGISEVARVLEGQQKEQIFICSDD